MSNTHFRAEVRRHECASPPAGEVKWQCTRKHSDKLVLFLVMARTAFAAGQVAGQHFDCHWSDLDIRLVAP